MFSKLKSGWDNFSSKVSSLLPGAKPDSYEETEPSVSFLTQCSTAFSTYNHVSESYKRIADFIKGKSQLIEDEPSPLPVYKIPLKDEQIEVSGCRCFSFGKESTKHNRTIMVLGATGAGKSTLINGMINYILGVEWEDRFRFKLVAEEMKSQAESQTSEVTVYKLNYQDGFRMNYSLTVIDTPGFGDTRGIQRDREITEQLRNLFTSNVGVSEIDAVCFVAQAALARLTPSQKYVFDSVLSIFGKDVAENIRVLVTFADGQRPPVLEAIIKSGVPCPKTADGLPNHFKFNNSALFAHNQSSDSDDDGGFDQMFWNMGTKSMRRFFAALTVIETKSLMMTQEVLRERQHLENSIENLQKQVKVGLAKLEEIKETTEKLKEHEAEISRNENFEFEINVIKPLQVNISGTGNFITNCQTCHHTCHYPCGIPNDDGKRGCVAMDRNGLCTECPGKCVWNLHFNQKYKWEYEEVKEKQTVKDLKEKYLKATEAKMPVETLINRLHAEYDNVQTEVVQLMMKSAKCLNRLKEIALKPNPLATPEYIDMLIEGEKSEAKPGWKQRIQYLIATREKAEYMAKVERGDDLLQNPSSEIQKANDTDIQDKTDTTTDTETDVDTHQDEAESVANDDPNDGEDESESVANDDPNDGADVDGGQEELDSVADDDPNDGADVDGGQEESDSVANDNPNAGADVDGGQDESESVAN
ncbi:uncharacterized protein [Antennarius striatus]|uniref:uncharacterized protein n=1 Tax=Antennarius striatus TaxID=241820 RepID=UPI0035AFCE58